MAFVRRRGGSPSLVATVYAHGRSRQVHLATFHGMRYVAADVRAQVEASCPHVAVDWDAVDLARAKGPPGTMSAPCRNTGDWASLEYWLRYWAGMEASSPRDAPQLLAAARVLRGWRMGVPDFHRESPPEGWEAVDDGRGGKTP